MILEHDTTETALFDKYGKYHSITEPQAPQMAVTTSGANITSLLSTGNNESYMFDDLRKNQSLSHITLNFAKPEGVSDAKLIIRAKGSLWLDYVYGEFTKLFGEDFDTWSEKQRKENPEVLKKRRKDHHIAIEVSLNCKNSWRHVDYFELVGPLGDARDMVMPIDVSEVEGNEITIKLETGFLFWELDYASMDFTPDHPIRQQVVKASTAIDEMSVDVGKLLNREDQQYLEQLEVGNFVELNFPAPEFDPGKKYSVFLHAKGYYEHIRQFEGRPNYGKLLTFYIPGRFPDYSRELYEAQYDLIKLANEPIVLSSNSAISQPLQ